MFSPCPSRCPFRENIGFSHDICGLSRAGTIAVGQHAVRAGESIHVQTWTYPQVH